MNTLYDILKISRDIIMKEPFYGIFLSTLNRFETDKVSIAGVRKNGINVELAVNPAAWEPLPYHLKYGILKHELLHICFFHPTMRDRYSDKKLFNIAADIEINQYIEDKWKQDGGFLEPELFDLPRLKGTDWYYKELKKMGDSNPTLNSVLASMQGDIHESWKEVEESSAHEKKLIEKQVQHQLQQADKVAKSRSNLPGALQEILDDINKVEPPVLDWKAFLRRFSGGSTKYFTHKTRRKESIRFTGNPGLKIKQKNHLFVAVDTSGSVSNSEFQEFLDQIHHIYKSGTEVTIGHADADMAHVEVYKGKKIKDRFGNGGTDFDPAIKYFNQHKSKFTSMVYFTDGECTPPTIKPQKPILWIISSKGKTLKTLPGLQIQIPDKH